MNRNFASIIKETINIYRNSDKIEKNNDIEESCKKTLEAADNLIYHLKKLQNHNQTISQKIILEKH